MNREPPPLTPPETDVPPEESGLGRGLPSVNALAGWPQRLSRWLAMGLMGAIGSALLITYYVHAIHRQTQTPSKAGSRPMGDMALPPLPRVATPGRPADASPYVIGNVMGEAPPLGSLAGAELLDPAAAAGGATALTPAVTPPVDRRLIGSAFETAGGITDPVAESATSEVNGAGAESSVHRESAGLSASYQTALTTAVTARRLPNRHLWMPRGATLDCTLLTAIDSSLPGLVTCLTAGDTFGADGTVVLLERGTMLVGETRSEMRAGIARIGIVWTEARTPRGVVVPLDSPATDALGRAGVDGQVERHFWERFGAAMLLSTIDEALQGASARGGGNTVVYGGGASNGVIEEVLKSTVAIPPTVRIAPGTRVQALVARDIDFRDVYALRLARGG